MFKKTACVIMGHKFKFETFLYSNDYFLCDKKLGHSHTYKTCQRCGDWQSFKVYNYQSNDKHMTDEIIIKTLIKYCKILISKLGGDKFDEPFIKKVPKLVEHLFDKNDQHVYIPKF